MYGDTEIPPPFCNLLGTRRPPAPTGQTCPPPGQSARCEDGFRDLFEEAPIAYLYEGLDSRIIRANRTAMRILGTNPEQPAEIIGKSLVAGNPHSRERLRDALAAVRRGVEVSGLVLELRRVDDGKPVWVKWWSRPVPGGEFTRTMFIDITESVLMQRETSRPAAPDAGRLEEPRSELTFADIIGGSAGMRTVVNKIHLVAPTNATVMITGESGTGKELVARAIHELSARNGRPLIKLNCSAVPDGLFESEFFGHVRGSFTNALRDKPGRFELADGGTLFLDEIAEVPLAMQAKLLRILQEQELERVGDTLTRKVDVRVIAATNRNLTAEVAAGRFRQDLFYRLQVFPVEVPPLRERPEDIGPLAACFIAQVARRMNRPEPTVTREALAQLASYSWPGNVRQLQNVIERSVILWQEGPLTFDLPRSPSTVSPPTPTGLDRDPPDPPRKSELLSRAELKRQERDAIIAALRRSNGKISGSGGAAALLGMKPSTFFSRMRTFGVNRETPDLTN